MFTIELFKKYSALDLNVLDVVKNPSELRKQIEVAIIDDIGLSQEKIDGLRRRGFDIHPLSDVEEIQQLETYPIVISDVNGVAKRIDPEKQGLALITEISKQYPHKGLAIYSGETYKLPSLPDGVIVINKDDDLEKWTEKIDTLIRNTANPVYVLKKLKKKLIDNDVDTETIRKIEQKYIKGILKREQYSSFTKSLEVSDDVKSIINGLITNGLFLGLVKALGL